MSLSLEYRARLFTEKQLETVLAEAITVLRQTPFRVQGTPEFLDYLSDYGCTIDGELVRFPRSVVDKVLGRCAHERATYEASAAAGAPSSSPASDVTVFTHGQALHICDPRTNALRPATTGDLADWCHLVDSIDITHRSHPTFIPTDVPMPTADLHAFATIVLNSSRPHPVSVYSADMLPYFVDICRIAKGDLDAVRRAPVFFAKAWVTSPFMLDLANVRIGMDARQQLGQPISFGHMPVAGASCPVTVAGALVQNTAESLALSAMRLAIDDLPQSITGSQAIMDMAGAFPRQLGPDLMLHGIAGMEMNSYLYTGRVTSGSLGWVGAGASTVSPQSIYEKATGYAMAATSGVRHFGAGCLAFSDVGSPVQLTLDLEMVGFFSGLFRQVHVDVEHMGTKDILDVAPTGGRYLETEHTARFFREECWLPETWSFGAFLSWAADPPDAVGRATAKTLDLMATAENHCSLSDSQRAEIEELVGEADRRFGAGASPG